MSKGVKFKELDGSSLKIGIVAARWNQEICAALFDKCKQGLADANVKEENIFVERVPGSYELPLGALRLIKNKHADAVICLGALIKGETMHFEYIAQAVSYGIMKLQLELMTPVVFGVLTCLDEKQAIERSIGDKSHAYEWGLTAVELGLLSAISQTS